MNKVHLSYLLPLGALALSSCAEKKQEEKRPNIIFMLTDDHTTQAMSCYGSQLIETPNMDRLANEGARFDNCYVTNAISGPSRACILTGKMSHINGFTDNASRFNGDQQTFPKLLQKAGYQTAVIGKWHLITEPQGFDFWSVITGQEEQGDYYKPDFHEMDKHIVEEGYVTDVITDKTINFIENRDKSKPFMVMYHQKAPHRNWMPAQRHLGKFNNTVFAEPETLFDDYSGRGDAAKQQDMSIAKTMDFAWDLKCLTREEIMALPDTDKYKKVYMRMTPAEQDAWDAAYTQRIAEYKAGFKNEKEMTSWKYQQYMRDYMATLLSVDENIGRLMAYLEEIGELDNTLIIYSSDQGFYLGEHGWFDKRMMYDECHTMPLLMRYPKVIKARTISDAIAMNIDFGPTMLDIAGVEVPADMQGVSLLPVLQNEGKAPAQWREAAYYHYYEYPAEHMVKRQYGVRTKTHKLIHFYNDIDQWEMYDMVNDPNELTNLYDNPAYKEVQAELHQVMTRAQELYQDTDPQEKVNVMFRGDRRKMDRQHSEHK